MFAYVVLFSLFFFLSYLEKSSIRLCIGGVFFNGRSIYCALIFIILTLFMGLRAESVGCDVVQYVYRYENVKALIEMGGTTMLEWGYNYLSYFFHDILGVPFQVFLFFLSSVTCFSIVFILYRYSEDVFTSLTLYLTLGCFTMAMSGLRQSLAISLLLLSLFFCEKRKIIPFLILCILAFSMHNSSLIFILVYFLWGKRLSLKTCFSLLVASFGSILFANVLIFFVSFFMPTKYSGMDLYVGYNINYLVLAVPVVITFFCTFFLDYEQDGKLNETDSFFFICSLLYLVMMFLSLKNNQLGRLSYYFSVGNLIIVASTLKYQMKKDVRSAKIVKFIILMFSYAYFFISTPGGTLKIDNYKMFFS